MTDVRRTVGTATALLLLGRGTDPAPSAASSAPATCPPPTTPTWSRGPAAAKAALGDRVFVLGHHYQRDEVIQFADVTGDSFKLAREAAARPDAEYIVFCGVHFMAESADILTAPDAAGVLPDLAAGCSMADMAAARRRSRTPGTRWPTPASPSRVVPVTYMNSSADIKAFCGRNGGAVCTSSQRRSRRWSGPSSSGRREGALPARPAPRPQHRRAASWACRLDDCVRLGPAQARTAGSPPSSCATPRMILWKGHCSVHGRFTADVRRRACATRMPGVQVLVHPECTHEVVTDGRPGRLDRVHHQDHRGGARPARRGRSAPSSTWCSGWPTAHPDKQIAFLDKTVCYCSTMNRIDLPHLVWALEYLVAGQV